MIPEITRKEWRDMIAGKTEHKISSFSLQMKINALKVSINVKQMNMENAIKDLYETCQKYERIYEEDLNAIFKMS